MYVGVVVDFGSFFAVLTNVDFVVGGVGRICPVERRRIGAGAFAIGRGQQVKGRRVGCAKGDAAAVGKLGGVVGAVGAE